MTAHLLEEKKLPMFSALFFTCIFLMVSKSKFSTIHLVRILIDGTRDCQRGGGGCGFTALCDHQRWTEGKDQKNSPETKISLLIFIFFILIFILIVTLVIPLECQSLTADENWNYISQKVIWNETYQSCHSADEGAYDPWEFIPPTELSFSSPYNNTAKNTDISNTWSPKQAGLNFHETKKETQESQVGKNTIISTSSAAGYGVALDSDYQWEGWGSWFMVENFDSVSLEILTIYISNSNCSKKM